jgi:hypothetical protein
MSGDDYLAPYRGIFLNGNSEIGLRYNENLKCYLPTQLALLADRLGKKERSIEWVTKGLDLAKYTNQTLAYSVLSIINVSTLILADKYEEAFEIVYEFSKHTVALQKFEEIVVTFYTSLLQPMLKIY